MKSQLRRLRPEEQESAVSMGYIGRMCVKKQDSKKHGYLEKNSMIWDEEIKWSWI